MKKDITSTMKLEVLESYLLSDKEIAEIQEEMAFIWELLMECYGPGEPQSDEEREYVDRRVQLEIQVRKHEDAKAAIERKALIKSLRGTGVTIEMIDNPYSVKAREMADKHPVLTEAYINRYGQYAFEEKFGTK